MERSDSKNVSFFFRILAGLCKTRVLIIVSGALLRGTRVHWYSHHMPTTSSTLNGVSADIWLTYCMSFLAAKFLRGKLTKLWTFAALISWNNDSIAHSRYITILTRLNRLRGFLVILPNLVWSSLCSSLFWELRGSRVVKNLQFWPQSLGVIRILIYRMWVIVCAWEACTILSRARDWVGVVSNCSMALF